MRSFSGDFYVKTNIEIITPLHFHKLRVYMPMEMKIGQLFRVLYYSTEKGTIDGCTFFFTRFYLNQTDQKFYPRFNDTPLNFERKILENCQYINDSYLIKFSTNREMKCFTEMMMPIVQSSWSSQGLEEVELLETSLRPEIKGVVFFIGLVLAVTGAACLIHGHLIDNTIVAEEYMIAGTVLLAVFGMLCLGAFIKRETNIDNYLDDLSDYISISMA